MQRQKAGSNFYKEGCGLQVKPNLEQIFKRILSKNCNRSSFSLLSFRCLFCKKCWVPKSRRQNQSFAFKIAHLNSAYALKKTDYCKRRRRRSVTWRKEFHIIKDVFPCREVSTWLSSPSNTSAEDLAVAGLAKGEKSRKWKYHRYSFTGTPSLWDGLSGNLTSKILWHRANFAGRICQAAPRGMMVKQSCASA